MNTPEQITVSRREFQRRMMEEVNGADNSYFAGEFFCHPPEPYEKLIHYLLRGGKASFEKRFKVQEGLAKN